MAAPLLSPELTAHMHLGHMIFVYRHNTGVECPECVVVMAQKSCVIFTILSQKSRLAQIKVISAKINFIIKVSKVSQPIKIEL